MNDSEKLKAALTRAKNELNDKIGWNGQMWTEGFNSAMTETMKFIDKNGGIRCPKTK